MERELEDELLLHVAAGTDLPTALAALPRDEQQPGPRGCIVAAVFVAMILAWGLLR